MTGDEGQTPFIDIPRGGNQIRAPSSTVRKQCPVPFQIPSLPLRLNGK